MKRYDLNFPLASRNMYETTKEKFEKNNYCKRIQQNTIIKEYLVEKNVALL